MATKSMGYDHPTYITRQIHKFPSIAAGANGISSKFVAFANFILFGIGSTCVAIGTSTYTAWNGTATVTSIKGESYSLIWVTNTAAAGSTPALSTTTYGPYVNSLYNGTATGTQTAANGFFNYVSLGGTGGIAGFTGSGGLNILAGDQVFIQCGTDATSVTDFVLDYNIQPLQPVGA